MKFCPTCQTRYDEDILRFCTKDGTPLIDEDSPNFTAMPSESSIGDASEDFGEETVIRRNNPNAAVPNVPSGQENEQERIVIPTAEPSVRAKTVPPQQQQQSPRKSSTAVVVLLTLLGTLAVLGVGLGGWYFLGRREANDTNRNVNTNTSNQNTNVNANNTNVNTNTEINANVNENLNVNVNANQKTPTPTPTKTPTPSPTKTPSPSPTAANTSNTNVAAPASPTPTATPTPKPSPTPAPAQTVSLGQLNSRAVSLPKPAYPPTARQMNASGRVTVQVTIDEEGNVISARAVSGHALLRNPAEAAARQSKFNPYRVGDRAVRASGFILYNFINQ